MKFFHIFSSQRRRDNSIWEIHREGGEMIHSFEDLHREAVRIFRQRHIAGEGVKMRKKVNVSQLLPEIFNNEDMAHIRRLISLVEVEGVLNSFAKEKISGPDYWTVEIFLLLFGLVGRELLLMIEESRTTMKVSSALNSTLVALIPKTS